MTTPRLRVLAVSPHPDDEAIGAPMTLQALAAAGHEVTNALCSLGRPADHTRRRSEAEESCARAGLRLQVAEPPANISSNDDLLAAQRNLAAWVGDLVATLKPDIVVSPQLHDLHHGHEVVARAVRDTLTESQWAGLWWQWTIWGDLPFPSAYVPFDQANLDRAQHALDAYAGENERNDYRNMLRGRAIANTALGSEKVFGFGATAASDKPYAELLIETRLLDHRWHLGQPRLLDPHGELALDVPLGPSIQTWLETPSARAALTR